MGNRTRVLLAGTGLTLFIAGLCIGGLLRSGELAADSGTRTMSIVRLYTGADNRSHFEDLQVPLKDDGKIGFLSERVQATGIVFRETGGDPEIPVHHARPGPCRTFFLQFLKITGNLHAIDPICM